MAATLCACAIFSKTLLWHPTGTINSRTKLEVCSSFCFSEIPLKPKMFYGSLPLRMRDFLEKLTMTFDMYKELVYQIWSLQLFSFFRNTLKTKNVLWQLPFAHARFFRKPYYDVQLVQGTRVPNLKSLALLVRPVEGFQIDRQTDRMTDGPMLKNHFFGISTFWNV